LIDKTILQTQLIKIFKVVISTNVFNLCVNSKCFD